MSKRSIQVDFSTNCSAAVLESKPVISGIVTARPSSEPISATQRAVPDFVVTHREHEEAENDRQPDRGTENRKSVH